MQQGYPISNLIGEVSDLDGKLYTVQYFERAVFEYHPENKPPYNVLLSQLGTFEYQRKYGQAGAPNQKPNNGRGSIYFPQTGRRVGGKFLQYWQSHGGLAQQGYPLSDEFTEVSPLNHLTYTVQYFERAVFEYHPENQPPYDVLLSLLGKFQYTRKYSGSQQIADFMVRSPIVVGDQIYWIDVRDHDRPAPHKSIYRYDLKQKREFPVTTSLSDIYALAGDGNRLAWVDAGDIMIHDFSNGNEGIVVEANAQRPIVDGTGIAVYGNTLYYSYKHHDTTGGPIESSLYAHNLLNQQDTLVTNHGEMPVASDGILLWESQDPNTQNGMFDLHMLNLRLPVPKDEVIAHGQFSNYSAWGDNVVWSGWGDPNDHDVHVYSLSSKQTTTIPARAAVNPIIRGNKIVWTDWLNRIVPGSLGSGIKSYDLTTGQQSTVVDDSLTMVQAWAITSDGRVVYTDQDDPLNGGLRKLYLK